MTHDDDVIELIKTTSLSIKEIAKLTRQPEAAVRKIKMQLYKQLLSWRDAIIEEAELIEHVKVANAQLGLPLSMTLSVWENAYE